MNTPNEGSEVIISDKAEAEPKLFGLHYDQLTATTVSTIAATQLYTWLNPINFFGHDLRLYLCLFIMLTGVAYCFVPHRVSAGFIHKVKGGLKKP